MSYNISTDHDCLRCGRSLPESEFGRDKRTSSGLRDWCRECTNQYARNKCQETSPSSLVEAAISVVYPKGLPEDRSTIDFSQIAFLSGADMKHIRLHIMRALQQRNDLILAEMREKNLAEFEEKQAALK